MHRRTDGIGILRESEVWAHWKADELDAMSWMSVPMHGKVDGIKILDSMKLKLVSKAELKIGRKAAGAAELQGRRTTRCTRRSGLVTARARPQGRATPEAGVSLPLQLSHGPRQASSRR